MAEAMISPLLSCPIVGGGSNPEVRISEISPEISKRVTEKFGIKNYTNMEELVEGTDMIVVAVKVRASLESFIRNMFEISYVQ